MGASGRYVPNDGDGSRALDASVLDHIRKLVDDAPPLNDEQRNHLALLLNAPTCTDKENESQAGDND